MNMTINHIRLRTVLFLMCLSFFNTSYAWHGGGWHGGGWHGGGWHGGGWHGGGWHGGVWHGGHWYGGGWGWGAPGMMIGVPIGAYYAAPCRVVRVCNPVGYCWLQRHCY